MLHDMHLRCLPEVPYYTELYTRLSKSQLKRLHICKCMHDKISGQYVKFNRDLSSLYSRGLITKQLFEEGGIKRGPNKFEIVVHACVSKDPAEHVVTKYFG